MKTNDLILDIVDYISAYDPYEFNDCYNSFKDAYIEIERNLSSPEGTKCMAEWFDNIVDEGTDYTGEADLLSDRLYEHLYTNFKPDTAEIFKQSLMIGFAIIIMMTLIFTAFVGAVIQTSERLAPENITNIDK